MDNQPHCCLFVLLENGLISDVLLRPRKGLNYSCQLLYKMFDMDGQLAIKSEQKGVFQIGVLFKSNYQF